MLIPLLMQLGMFGPKAGVRKFTPAYETDKERELRAKELRANKPKILKGVQPEEFFTTPPSPDLSAVYLAQEQLKAMLLARQMALTAAQIRDSFNTLRPLLLDLPRVTSNKRYSFPKKLAQQLEIKPSQEQAKKLKRIVKLLQEQEEEETVLLLF